MTQFVASFALDLGTVAKIFPVIHLGQEYLQHSQKNRKWHQILKLWGGVDGAHQLIKHTLD